MRSPTYQDLGLNAPHAHTHGRHGARAPAGGTHSGCPRIRAEFSLLRNHSQTRARNSGFYKVWLRQHTATVAAVRGPYRADTTEASRILNYCLD